MGRLRHPLRLTSRLVTLTWLWRNRHDIARWVRFAARLPADIQERGVNPAVAEARLRIALSADPRTRSARDLDIAGLEDGTVVVCTPAEKPAAQLAREVLAGAPGVKAVRFVDPPLPRTADTRRSPTSSTAASPGGNGVPTATSDAPDDGALALGPAESRS